MGWYGVAGLRRVNVGRVLGERNGIFIMRETEKIRKSKNMAQGSVRSPGWPRQGGRGSKDGAVRGSLE